MESPASKSFLTVVTLARYLSKLLFNQIIDRSKLKIVSPPSVLQFSVDTGIWQYLIAIGAVLKSKACSVPRRLKKIHSLLSSKHQLEREKQTLILTNFKLFVVQIKPGCGWKGCCKIKWMTE